MGFLVFLELFFFIALIVFMISQVLIPGLRDRSFFPLFRRSKHVKELVTVKGAIDEAEIEQEVRKEKKALKKINNRKG